MHSSTCDLEPPRLGGAEVFVAIAALVTEGRTPASKTSSTAAPEKPGAPAKHRSSGAGFSEGAHCTFSKASQGHVCNLDNLLCIKYDKIRSYVLSLWQKSLPLCIDVLLVPNCCCENDLVCNPSTTQEPIGFAMLLEQWNINVLQRRTHDISPNLNINQLISAIRSQLYFSQISAWLASPDEKIRSSFQDKTIVYCLTVPGETFGCKTFASNAQHHNFPTADLGNGVVVKVSLSNVPRTEEIPHIKCSKCDVPNNANTVPIHDMHAHAHAHAHAHTHSAISVLDDRMQMSCTLKGKHRCDDYEDFENNCTAHQRFKRHYMNLDATNKSSSNAEGASIASTSRSLFSNLSNLIDGGATSTTNTNNSAHNNHNNQHHHHHHQQQQQQQQQQHQGTSKSKQQQQQQQLMNSNVVDHKCDMKYNDVAVPVKGILGLSHGKGADKNDGAPKVDLELSRKEFVEVLSVLRQSVPMKSQNAKKHDLANKNQGDILLDAILRSSKVQSDDEIITTTTVVAAAAITTTTTSAAAAATKTKTITMAAAAVGKMENDAITISDNGGGGGCGGGGGKHISPSSPNSLSLERHKRKGALFLKSLYPDVGVDGGMRVGDNMCDNKNDSIISDNRSLGGNDNIYIDINCDNIKRKKTTDYIKMCDISNVFSLEYLQKRQKVKVKQKITFDDNNHHHHHHHHHQHHHQNEQHQAKNDKCNNKQEEIENNRDYDYDDTCLNNKDAHTTNAGIIPSALEQAKFRKSLDNAASMVFHSRTGLPLTSSPAPVRRGKSCFDFDSSINSVSAIRSALFSLASCSTDEDSESDCSIVSPCSPETTNGLKQREIPLINYRHRGQSSGLLGSFVESVLNGRLEPVSTVHGFSAELGASGSFCPRHVVLPVTVFFYTLGDNDKVSTPYLGHINLGKKGYNVPKSGTIQVTLFNPLGTVVKMFVIMYDLSDMPPNSQTFIRQRTLFMPANCEDKNLEWSQKWLRYLIHLRFMSSKSGRIYLHSDIRMIICRKSDLDTATAHGIDMSYELRSFINSPTNPRFSPRK